MPKPAPAEKLTYLQKLRGTGRSFVEIAREDRLFLPLVLVAVLIPLAATGIAIALGLSWLYLPMGVMLALLGVLIVLKVRAEKVMVRRAEKQPGGVAAIVELMRGDWRVTPAVSATTDMDMVHLVVGRPGVILLGEGDAQRVRGLIAQEKRRLAKVIGSADMRDFVVGKGKGEVPMAKLRMTLMKLPRTSTGKDVNALDKRLKALTARPQLPKGAIPKSMRPPKGAFRATRGR